MKCFLSVTGEKTMTTWRCFCCHEHTQYKQQSVLAVRPAEATAACGTGLCVAGRSQRCLRYHQGHLFSAMATCFCHAVDLNTSLDEWIDVSWRETPPLFPLTTLCHFWLTYNPTAPPVTAYLPSPGPGCPSPPHGLSRSSTHPSGSHDSIVHYSQWSDIAGLSPTDCLSIAQLNNVFIQHRLLGNWKLPPWSAVKSSLTARAPPINIQYTVCISQFGPSFIPKRLLRCSPCLFG